MILKFKTGSLPPNFIFLGIILGGVGIWRMAVLDWKGIMFFVIAMFCLFITSGFSIDAEKVKIREYVRILFLKFGKWQDIHDAESLEIIMVREAQNMSVLSINRSETIEVYKLMMIFPDRELELISGKEDYIVNTANTIASSLNLDVVNSTRC